jgi:antitoxin component of RelBE/YafQ-DinJ toxin-antitoxin module
VKKTQILRIRVDVNTLAALTRYCETHGQTLSSTLRRFLSRGVRKADDPAMSLEHAKAWKNGETRRFCAETIASLLITQVLPPSDTAWRQETWAEKMAGKREHVAQLVDEIFRILSESDNWLAAAPDDDDEDHALAYEDEPVLGDRLE